MTPTPISKREVEAGEGGRHPVLDIEDLISLMLSSGENGAGAVIKAQRVTSKEGWKKQGMRTHPLENIEKIEGQASISHNC